MTSDQLASMYAEVVRGTPKAQSRFLAVSGFSAAWDTVTREVAELRAGGVTDFEVPNEVPAF